MALDEINGCVFRNLESLCCFPDGQVKKIDQPVLTEYRLILNIDHSLETTIVCTPTHIREMICGRLYTTGKITSADDIVRFELCDNHVVAALRKPISENTAPQMSFCSGKEYWEPQWIFDLTKKFKSDMAIHKHTGGTHSCYLGYDGKIIFQCEDISRHNAVDKIIGYMLLNKLLPEHCLVFTTGRVPEDMAEKIIKAGIPVLVSKSVPTWDAVQLARRSSLTLICKAWPDSFEVFSAGNFRKE